MYEHDSEIKCTMNWINSRPKGWTLRLGGRPNATNEHKLYQAVRKMRKKYFPQLAFENGKIYRGYLDMVPHVVSQNARNSVIFMWKKGVTNTSLRFKT